jgi:hypothetical protein
MYKNNGILFIFKVLKYLQLNSKPPLNYGYKDS